MTARAAKRAASSPNGPAASMSPVEQPSHDSSTSPVEFAAGESSGNGLQPPRKRKRRVVSCAECHRRKQKCDRNQPCKACIDRKMESSCHYETAAMSRERHHLRVIEAAAYGRALQAGGTLPVKAAGFGYAQTAASTLGFLRKIDGNDGPDDGGGGGGSGSRLVDAIGDGSDPTIGMAVVPTSTAAEEAALAAEQQYYYHSQHQQQHPQQHPPQHPPQHQQQQQHHQPQHHPTHDLLQSQHAGPPGIDPYGTADRYKALIRGLPPRAYIDRLVGFFFRDFNWQYYALDEDVFLKQLADWSDVATGPFGSLQAPHQLSPDLRAFPALLFQVLATGLLSLPPADPDPFFDDIKHAANTTFEDLAIDYSEAGMAILALLGKRQMSFTTVLAGFVRAALLKYVALVTEAWHALGSAIRDAQEIGLHRDSMDPKPWAATAEAVLENQWEIQRRRRLWMILCCWDVQMGVVLGRPTSIDPSAVRAATLPVDCLLPATAAERAAMPVQPRSPLQDPPTPLTRAIWAFQAVVPLREIIELEKEGPCPRDFARVDALHARLEAIEASTPPWFRLENPDTRFDDLPSCFWLPAIRATLPQTSIFNFMALHRPYIFTRARSRTEALKACLTMLRIQRIHFSRLKPQQYKTFSLFYGSFDSLVLMATIYILFPKEHPELVPEAIQQYRWSVERFELMMEHYSLARSALDVLQAIYLRLRKTLGISFLETESGGLAGIGGAVGAAVGTAPIDAITLSNIDPSLKDEGPIIGGVAQGPQTTSALNGKTITGDKNTAAAGDNSNNNTTTGGCGTAAPSANAPASSSANGLTPGAVSSASGPSSAASEVFSATRHDTPTTEPPSAGIAALSGGGGGAGGGAGAGSSGLDSGSTPGDLVTAAQAADRHNNNDDPNNNHSNNVNSNANIDPALEQMDAPTDLTSLFPDFDWTSLQPICPTGDLAYNILMGVASQDGSAAAYGWNGAGGGRGPGGGMPATEEGGSDGGLHSSSGDVVGGGSGGDPTGGLDLDSATASTVLNSATMVDGTAVPWQFAGDFSNNSIWGLLNNYTPF